MASGTYESHGLRRLASFLFCYLMGAGPGLAGADTSHQAALRTTSTPLITIDGLVFKDLNRNARLDVFEDWRKSAPERAADLVANMTLEEKAGLMMHGTPPSTSGTVFGDWDFEALAAVIQQKHVSAFI